MRRLFPLPMAAAILGLLPTSVMADEPETLLDRWMQLYHDSAKTVELRLTGRPDAGLALHPTPLLKYTNPVRRVRQHGAIYVWTIEKRPAVIASFWSAMPESDWRRLNFEWHSLHDAPLSAGYEGKRLWNTREKGLEWQALADAASPGKLPPQRLVQMRRIASSFSAEIHTEESELRLMPQPVFRYQQPADGVVDGAIFAFVMGTDPELFLLVEARADANGSRQWHAGCVRFTNRPLTVRRDGRAWWSCPHVRARFDDAVQTGKYYLHLEIERLPADPADRGEKKQK